MLNVHRRDGISLCVLTSEVNAGASSLNNHVMETIKKRKVLNNRRSRQLPARSPHKFRSRPAGTKEQRGRGKGSSPAPRTFDPLGVLRRDEGDVGAGEKQGERQGRRRRATRPHLAVRHPQRRRRLLPHRPAARSGGTGRDREPERTRRGRQAAEGKVWE